MPFRIWVKQLKKCKKVGFFAFFFHSNVTSKLLEIWKSCKWMFYSRLLECFKNQHLWTTFVLNYKFEVQKIIINSVSFIIIWMLTKTKSLFSQSTNIVHKSNKGSKFCLNVDFWNFQAILNKTSIYNFFISQIVFVLQPIKVRCKKNAIFCV